MHQPGVALQSGESRSVSDSDGVEIAHLSLEPVASTLIKFVNDIRIDAERYFAMLMILA